MDINLLLGFITSIIATILWGVGMKRIWSKRVDTYLSLTRWIMLGGCTLFTIVSFAEVIIYGGAIFDRAHLPWVLYLQNGTTVLLNIGLIALAVGFSIIERSNED